MSNDEAPERSIDPEDLGRENQNAFSNVRSMAADLGMVQELEQEVLSGNNVSTADANSAEPSKS